MHQNPKMQHKLKRKRLTYGEVGSTQGREEDQSVSRWKKHDDEVLGHKDKGWVRASWVGVRDIEVRETSLIEIRLKERLSLVMSNLRK